jgi:hypothetical protein
MKSTKDGDDGFLELVVGGWNLMNQKDSLVCLTRESNVRK